MIDAHNSAPIDMVYTYKYIALGAKDMPVPR